MKRYTEHEMQDIDRRIQGLFRLTYEDYEDKYMRWMATFLWRMDSDAPLGMTCYSPFTREFRQHFTRRQEELLESLDELDEHLLIYRDSSRDVTVMLQSFEDRRNCYESYHHHMVYGTDEILRRLYKYYIVEYDREREEYG